jgi:Polyketide cyclase / dehydrase and lipid transport
MARYQATLTSPESREVVFDYLADFRSAAEWDPGVRAARLRGGEPGQPGAEFEITSRFLGREIRLVYRAVEVDRPHRVLLVAQSSSVVSRDEITVADLADGGTTLTYTADLHLRGPLRILDPALRILFSRIGDNARDGLATKLARPLPQPRQASAR